MRHTGVLAMGMMLCLGGCGPESREDSTPVLEYEARTQQIVGPGLGNLSYGSGELFQRISVIVDEDTIRGGHGNVAMVNGYLFTIWTTDSGGANGSFSFWDVSNPRSPVRKYAYVRPAASKLREPHGFGFTSGYSGKTYLFAQSTTGFQVWDLTDPASAALVKDVVLPGVNAGDYTGVWWAYLQAPYVYVAGGSAGLFIVDMSIPATPVIKKILKNAELGITRANQVTVIGNLMIVNYVQDGSAIALLDVSDPANPVVKYTTTALPPTPYSINFNGGRVASAGKSDSKLSLFNVNFDATDTPSGLSAYGVATGSGLSGGGYLTFQDGFVHAGFSNNYAKFDARTLPITQVGTANPGAPYNGDIDFSVALGNLAFLGNDHGRGSALVVHQTAPDTTGPAVNFVSPRNGAINRNVLSRVGLTFTDAVELNSLSTTTIIVRKVGGSALPGKYSTQGNGIVNFFPDRPFAANTTYEIYVPAGGVKDYVGNANPTAFSSRFSTGTTILAVPTGCVLGKDATALVGAAVSFNASGCAGTPPLSYSWSFGDGTSSAWSASSAESYTYKDALHYNVILTVKDGAGQSSTFNRRQTVTYAATSSQPTRSSTIIHDTMRGRVSVVNSDANTVASIAATPPFTKQWETAVGKNPQTLAQPTAGGEIWVVCQDDATIHILDGGTGVAKGTIALPYASRPFAIAFDPAGSNAYVTLEGTGRLLKLDPLTKKTVGSIDVEKQPRGIAVSGDGARILVTRFLSASTGGEVREIASATFSVTRLFALPLDTTTLSTESDGPGLPNYVQSVTISPDGRRAFIPSTKVNIQRGTGPTSDGTPLTFESRVRTMMTPLDLVSNTTDLAHRVDLNNADVANAVVWNAAGDYAFVSTQGTNRVDIYDALSHQSVAAIFNTGLAPRGLLGAGNYLFVQNFMSRDIAVFDIGSTGDSNNFPRLATIAVQGVEPLAAQILLGKQVFYNAADFRMSRESYISCASCHLNGDADGQVWDDTQGGEGVRNTGSLLGRGGVGRMGRVHWTGNFDEIQDFENNIRNAFGGAGFLGEADFAATQEPLGPAKAGLGAELDALAVYVATLTKVLPSPYRNADGTMTTEALAGKALFEAAAIGCASCHTGTYKTDSALSLLHDVGTISAASGKRLGATLTGFDTPTLLGVWATPPYLHDGSAATLLDVITTRNPKDLHGSTSILGATEKAQLAAYLQQLDGSDLVELAANVTLVSSGKKYDTTVAAAGAESYIDRAFRITALDNRLVGGVLVRTANADKTVNAATHLQLSVNKAVTVHVGMDKRTILKPGWLSSFTLSTEEWKTTDAGAVPYKVYTKSFPAGTITLGGNLQAPALGVQSHYSVILTSP